MAIEVSFMRAPAPNAHWRDSARPAKFFIIDFRAVFPIFFCTLHLRLWTVIVAVGLEPGYGPTNPAHPIPGVTTAILQPAIVVLTMGTQANVPMVRPGWATTLLPMILRIMPGI